MINTAIVKSTKKNLLATYRCTVMPKVLYYLQKLKQVRGICASECYQFLLNIFGRLSLHLSHWGLRFINGGEEI